MPKHNKKLAVTACPKCHQPIAGDNAITFHRGDGAVWERCKSCSNGQVWSSKRIEKFFAPDSAAPQGIGDHSKCDPADAKSLCGECFFLLCEAKAGEVRA